MRETKYRVWCKNKNEWEKDCCFLGQDGALYHYGRGGGFLPLRKDTHIVVFFTGLKDKNSKEVFEGDIVKVLFDTHTIKNSLEYKIGKIAFYMGSFVLTFKEAHNSYTLMDKLKNYIKEIEIIGNIWENSELLNETY